MSKANIDKDEFIATYNELKSLKLCAQHFKCGLKPIKRLIKECNIVHSRKIKVDIEEIIKIYEKTKTFKNVQNILAMPAAS